MGTPLHQLRVNAVELLRQPGAEQRIVDALAADELDIDDDRISSNIAVDITATSTIDGVVVGGTVSVPFSTGCRRCTAPVDGVAVAQVEELYQYELSDDDAELIDGALIDLAPVVRQYALLELPTDVLCRDDCAGLCPNCGTDRNTEPCGCDTTVRDERWAALDGLVVDEGADGSGDSDPNPR